MIIPSVNTEASDYTLSLNNSWKDGEISTDGQINYYKVTTTSAGTLHIDYQAWSINCSNFQVLNADKTETYIEENISGSSENSPQTKSVDLNLEKGVYYIRICGYYLEYTGSYRVRAKFTAAKNNETEPNDSFAKAMKLSANKKITGFLSENDEIDFYKISVPKSQTVTFTLQSRIYRIDYSVWNSDFEKIYDYYNNHWMTESGSESSPTTFKDELELSSGTYYIKICKKYGYTGRYILSWSGQKVTSISISGNKTVQPGKTFTLKASVSPSNAVNKSVTWSSGNTKVATVDSSTGKVTAVKPGKAVIKAKAKDGSKVTKKITVIVVPKSTSISSVQKSGSKAMKVKWKKSSGATGYQIQYSKNSKFKSSVKKSVSGTSYTAKGLSSGTYYVRVRPVIKIGSKTYAGSWSSAKKIRIK
jgi:hypothetical protein